MGESEHGRHVFFIAVIMSRYTQYITWAALGIFQTGQDQVAVIIIAMKQETVISVNPGLSGKEADILGLDHQNLTAVFAVEGLI